MAQFQWGRTPYPAPKIFDSFGANNHSGTLTDDYLLTGMGKVRLDAAWWQVEKARKSFDLAWTDQLIRPYVKAGVQPLVILAANNPVYYTERERKILAKPERPWLPFDVGLEIDAQREDDWVDYAYQVILRHCGLKVDWEMMNEVMDGGFWHTIDGQAPAIKDVAASYFGIVKKLAARLQLNPKTRNEKLVVGVSYGSFEFLEAIFALGILKIAQVKAVSFHAYRERGVPPEAIRQVWQDLRTLIDHYAGGRTIPMISSEWGYDEESCDAFMTQAQADKLALVSGLPTALSDSPWADVRTDIRQEIQADLLMRMFKTNLQCADLGLAYSIWYRFPGADQTFGMFDQSTPPKPKPTFKAMTGLRQELQAWGLLPK